MLLFFTSLLPPLRIWMGQDSTSAPDARRVPSFPCMHIYLFILLFLIHYWRFFHAWLESHAWESMRLLFLEERKSLWWVADVDTFTSTLSVSLLCVTVFHGPAQCLCARKRPLLFSSTPAFFPTGSALMLTEHDCNWLQIRWPRNQ